MLVAGGVLAGIGFTMALFIAELAFDPDLLDTAKLSILAASVACGATGMLALVWLTAPGRQSQPKPVAR
jgi:Na+:H+ antiporter, NhaA family